MKNGVTFKGLHSKRDIGVTMRSVNRFVLPGVSRSTVQVPFIPGSVDFGTDTYTDGEIAVNFAWLTNKPSESAKKGEVISGWLHNDGEYRELIFDDRPDRKFFAKVISAVPMAIDACSGMVSVIFAVNPPYAFRLDNTPVSPQDVQDRLIWDTAKLTGYQYIQTFLSPGAMRFTVSGGIPVKPVIKLYGRVPAGLKLTHGAQIWQYNATLPFDGIRIDCDAETVTRISNGSNLYGNVSPADYFEISPGQAEIDVSGAIGAFPDNITVAVEFISGH